MNADALLKFFSWHTTPETKPTAKKDFPPEAYSYDSPITKEAIEEIQREADKTLEKQQWTVIERLGDGR